MADSSDVKVQQIPLQPESRSKSEEKVGLKKELGLLECVAVVIGIIVGSGKFKFIATFHIISFIGIFLQAQQKLWLHLVLKKCIQTA